MSREDVVDIGEENFLGLGERVSMKHDTYYRLVFIVVHEQITLLCCYLTSEITSGTQTDFGHLQLSNFI